MVCQEEDRRKVESGYEMCLLLSNEVQLMVDIRERRPTSVLMFLDIRDTFKRPLSD